MDQLEEAGIVDSEEGTAPRRILMSLNEFETYEFISTNGQEQQNNIDVDNTLSDADMLLIYLNIIANFSNDGQQLSKLDHYIIGQKLMEVPDAMGLKTLSNLLSVTQREPSLVLDELTRLS